MQKAKNLVILLIVLLFLSTNDSFASALPIKLKFHNISKDQGLSSSKVYCTFQDSKGYIWIGTAQGLNLYDGYKVTTFYYNANDKRSLSSNDVNSIAEDKDHNVWIGTGLGLNKYDRKKNTFIRIVNDGTNRFGIGNNITTSILCDSKGTLFVGTMTGGLRILERGKSIFRKVNFLEKGKVSTKFNSISCLYQDLKGKIWIGTKGDGLLSLQNGSYRSYVTQKSNIICSNNISTITQDKKENLWIGTSDSGLSYFNVNTLVARKFHSIQNRSGLASNVIKSILADSRGNLWVGTENGGIHFYDYNTNQILPYRGNPSDPSSFSQSSACGLLEDTQHNVYVGSHSGGLYVYNPNRYQFNLMADHPTNGQLSHRDVKAFCEVGNGALWIGTDGGGINVWQRNKNSFYTYRFNPQNPRSISSDAVLTIYKDSQGIVWVGTWGGGLNRYNPQTNDFTRFMNNPKDKTSISSNNISQIFEDSRGTLWIGTFESGLNILDRTNLSFRQFRAINDKKIDLSKKGFLSIFEDKDQGLWFGSNESTLYNYNVSQGKLRNYFYPTAQRNRSFFGNVEVMFTDSKGRMWIGKNGLMIFDEKTKNFILPSLGNRFSNTTIFGILEDNDGYLWISSTSGLFQYNTDSNYLKNYTNADGVQGLEFSRNAYYKTTDGEMLFGGNRGFNYFKAEDIKDINFVPPVYLSDFQLFNKSINSFDNTSPLREHISQAKEVVLHHSQSVFSFEYVALNLLNPEKTRYAYKMVGFDKAWNFVGNLRRATYTNLNPGHYTFQVKSTNSNGNWNDTFTAIDLTIIPPFWMTWWFRTLMTLILVSSVITLLYFRRKFELKQLEEEKREEIHLSQLQFFTNISHELRTPLSLILGPLERIMKEDSRQTIKNSYLTMHRNALRLMKLISEIIDYRKVASGNLKLKVSNESLALLVNDITTDFSDKASELGIDLSTKTTTNQNLWFDRQVIEKVIINLLHNSLKYTSNGGTVSVETFGSFAEFKPQFKNELILKSGYEAKSYTYICVTDDGVGISKSSMSHLFERYFRVNQTHLGSGLGLAFVKSLVFLHKGEIYVYSEKKKGTQILVALPVDAADYLDTEKSLNNLNEPTIYLETIQFKSELSSFETRSALTGLPEKNNEDMRTILLVDDNDELRAFLKECMEDRYYILEAINGQQGLEIAKEKLPDLIISDVMMPVMDGIEFCKALKGDIETSHIPFILLTAKDALATKLSGVGYGADHYFSKPVNIDLLSFTIQNLFDQRQKLKEKYLKDYTITAKELAYSIKDKEFIEKITLLIEQKIENPDFNVEEISREIGMSQTTLLRKMKEITGQTVNEFVRSIRLKTALHILTHEDVLVTEVMYRVGILSQSYFSTIFKKEFGKTPSQFLQELNNGSKK
ncbi:hybrid sensor histidine kinase/response regulator [Pedobacter frigiditerrae]|uniref:histidine kinase n=1 Tax=Pedobacter frigiditerrae TaxID=2530452 RepID=A0A4R0MRT4_9SPHI|nr:two-component regulator propeller domain-containing protein [Pedobacter frigiditerrae]TCC88734.1 hybrid sensor histidine kinase/response regulator [Pedobacter frigiditerrae]